MKDDKKVSSGEARILAEKYGMKYYETSARSGTNVKEVFEGIT